jgi:hypothetical protein
MYNIAEDCKADYKRFHSLQGTWNQQFIKTLQKTAKRQAQYELIVHQGDFDPFVGCVALFDEHFNLQGIRIKIKTNTSTTVQTIPLPIKQIFT